MPIGNPKAETRAKEKWNAKAGYVSKSYKLKEGIAKSFKEACESAGRSQASVLTELMTGFVESQKSGTADPPV